MTVRDPVRTTPFGANLRHWRLRRGLSQLALAGAAATPPRHVSFLETGRSRPSHLMVSRLAEALDLSLRERNVLLSTAGFAPDYPESRLDAEELAPFRRVLDQMMSKHDPYPAYVIDRHWNIVQANAAASAFLPPDGERNAVRLTYAGAWRHLISNWADIAWVGVRRLQADVDAAPDDLVLSELLDVAVGAASGVPRPMPAREDLVLCPHFDVGNRIVRTMSVVAAFGAAQDVTLDELRIELIYPADEDAVAFFADPAR